MSDDLIKRSDAIEALGEEPYGTLRNIADELRNIRKILEKKQSIEVGDLGKQSPRLLTVTRSHDNELAIVNLDHVTCVTPDGEGAKIWFDTGEEDNLRISEHVIEFLNKYSEKG